MLKLRLQLRNADEETAQAVHEAAFDIRFTKLAFVRDCLRKYWDLMPARGRKRNKKYFAEVDELAQHVHGEQTDYFRHHDRLHELMSQLANAAGEVW